MVLSIIGVIFCIAAGISKAVQDTLAHHFSSSIFSDKYFYNPLFWNPNKSWMNKWDYSTGTKEEKFLGSSTIFVAFTDAWHLAQFFNLNLLILGVFLIGIKQDYYALIVGVLLYRVVFEVTYRWGLKK